MTIEGLCRHYTALSETDIEEIENMANWLPTIANLVEADVFIDCPTTNGKVIVVAEAKPVVCQSSYEKSVVGELASEIYEPAVAQSIRKDSNVKRMKAITQEGKCVIQTVEPIHSQTTDHLIGVLIKEKALKEPEERKEAEVLIRAMSAEQRMHLMEYLEEGMMIVDQRGMIRYANQWSIKLYQRLGFIENPIGRPYRAFSLIKSGINHSEWLLKQEVQCGDNYLVVRHVRINDGDGSFVVLIKDITRERRQENEIILKSVAMKEIHHRIKNNLQTVASLLRLQRRRSKNEETREALDKCMLRILSIAGTHEVLSQSVSSDVKILKVIENIRQNMMMTADPEKQIDILIEGDDFYVPSDISTTIALVVNEIVQNSMKYAFKDRDSGLIVISIKHTEVYSTIIIKDNGCGFDTTEKRPESLGLSIVKSMVRDKLHGGINIVSNQKGTEIEIKFANYSPEMEKMQIEKIKQQARKSHNTDN